MSDSTGGVLGPSTNWAPLLSSTESLDMGFRVQTAISEIREHFERQGPRLRFEDLAGKGAAGMVFRLVESDSRGPLPGSRGRVRRLALKRPLSVLHDDLVRTEIKWLQKLANGEHIVRMLAFRDDPRDDAPPQKKRFGRMRRWWKTMRRESLDASLKGLKGPVYIMEHLENGTLHQFYRNIEHENYRVPNKVLWSFLLCLLRACAAMAYPLENMEAEDTQLEETRPAPPYTLCHSDMHMGNAMIGNIGNFAEHNVVPGLKLIDFGFAEPRYLGEVWNLYSACLLVMRLITRAQVERDEIRDLKGGRQTPLSIEMLATWHVKYPRLDPVLTDLLARAVAYDQDTRPSLTEMLDTARVQAAQPGYGGGLGHAPESEAYVRGFLQNILYDAVPDRLNNRGSVTTMHNDPYEIISASNAGF